MGPPPPPGTVEPCRNPQCPGRGLKPSFEEDRRKGDRICLHCGATSRCRPEEEEHRSFADDDGKSEKRKRAEVLAPGRAGARVGDKNLAQAVALANSGVESEHSDLGKVEQKRLKGYNDKIASLLSHQFSQAHTGMSQEVQEAAHSLADKLVRSQAEHDTHCEKVQLSEQLKKAGDADGAQRCKCRLSQKPKNHAVVAAVLLMHAEREHGTTHQFQEVATLLQGDAQSRDVSMADVGKIEKLVKELLSLGAIRREVDGGFGKYPCAAEPGFKLKDGETAAGDARGSTMTQHKSLLPNLCGRLQLHYMIQRRASQILDGWGSEGIRTLRPQTVAAAAVHFAYEEKKGVLFSSEAGQAPPSLDLGRLAKQAGVEKGTILRAMTELPVPPPEEQQQAGPSRVLE